jgi:sodium transport system permease protein
VSLRTTWVVWRKELGDGLRDRRSLMSALLFPLFGPVLIAFLFNNIVSMHSTEKPLELPVAGKENAPGLIAHLEESGVGIVPAPEDPEAAVRDGDLDMVLLIPPGYGKQFREATPARLELVIDSSRSDASTPVRRVKQRIEAYGSQIGALRLLARGVHPQVAQAVDLHEVDMATPERIAANMLNMVPMFVLMAAFIGGMYVATDAAAGERERGSLEPLLLTPVSRVSLVTGKWLATTTLSGVGVVLTAVGSAVALTRVPLEEIGVELRFGGSDLWWLAIALLPLAPLAAAVQLVVATFARSFREAQTYLSVLMLLPMLPGMILTFRPAASELWMMFVPALSQQALVMDVLRGEPAVPAHFAIAGAVSLLLSIAAVRMTAWLFEREKIVFGG